MKRIFGNFNAKLALVVMALTGSLLTGCYKDDGLDVNSPGSVTVPAATYTLVGTVVNSAGELVTDAKVTVTPNTSLTLNGASFTAAVTKGDVVITVTPKEGSDYKTTTKTVTIKEIPAGQSVVYTETIVLTKDPVEMVDAKYNLDVIAFGSSDLNTKLDKANYDVVLKDGKGVTVATSVDGTYKDLAFGMYNVQVTPKKAVESKYNSYTTLITLAQVKVKKDAPALDAQVSAVLIEKQADKEYRILSGFVTVTGTDIAVSNLQILKNGVGLATSSANYILCLDVKDANAVYKLVVNYVEKGENKQVVRMFTDNVNAFSLTLTGTDAPGFVTDGKIEKDIDMTIAGEDKLAVEGGTLVKKDQQPYTGDFNVSRLIGEELENPATMRAFEGTPSGLTFDPAMQIAFTDSWNNELGNFELLYWKDGQWVKESGDNGAISKDQNGKYVMNIAHFSKFKAEVAVAHVAPVPADGSDSNTTTIDKKNDTDHAITKDFEYSYYTGADVDVAKAVTNAGFKNQNAIDYVINLIGGYLAANNIPVAGVAKKVTGVHPIIVNPWTCLEEVTKTQNYQTYAYKFVIAGKTIEFSVKNYTKVDFSYKMYEFGHGHGHGHGHGGNLNAGGGLVEVE